MRRVNSLCVVLASVNQCGGTSPVLMAPSASRRSYFWPYTEDFVPAGTVTSSFQASSLPSVRERIVREYAFGPLFGSRTPLCVLGFSTRARDVIGHKPAIRAALADLLSCDVSAVHVGPLQEMKDMMLHRSGTLESPRLADGPASGHRCDVFRRTHYARQPIVARTVMEVFVSDDVVTTASERVELSKFLQDRLSGHEREAAAFDSEHAAPTASPPTSGMVAEEGEQEDDREVRARVLDAVEELKGTLGVVYCEIPTEELEYNFDALHGEPTEDTTASEVMGRWAQRLARKGKGDEEKNVQAPPASSSSPSPSTASF